MVFPPQGVNDPRVLSFINNLGGVSGLLSGMGEKTTVYSVETAPAVVVNGVTWKDLLDRSLLSYYTEIWSITLTLAGAWAGLCQLRIIDKLGNKIFPFGIQAVQNTDFVSGIQWLFPAPVRVTIDKGYRIQFRSSNVADGAGETCALTELGIIQLV